MAYMTDGRLILNFALNIPSRMATVASLISDISRTHLLIWAFEFALLVLHFSISSFASAILNWFF